MKVAIYARVSTSNNGQDPTMQTRERPRVYLDPHKIAALRAEGLSWAKIAKRLGAGEGTVYRAALESTKNRFGSDDTACLQSAAD
jgi:DNA invertase Pin-like site-specific DNA recombinase